MRSANSGRSSATSASHATGLKIHEAKLLSIDLLKLAQKTIRRCKSRKDRGPTPDILEVYVLVAASLEAFINEVCLEKVDLRKQQKKGTRHLIDLVYGNKGRGEEIRVKWEKLPQFLCGKTFDKGQSLWQDFDALVRLRNAILHYKSEYREVGYVPRYLVSIINRLSTPPEDGFQARPLSLLDYLFASKPNWVYKIGSLAMGQWAFDTGVSIIYQFLDFLRPHDRIRQDYAAMLDSARIPPRLANTD